uniref:hydrolase n=1 Tax=Streptomyces hydrogenans TaxID=1873719 RepID=UPI001E4D7D8A|nr:hydrolase [Streptomyces hydrogenans]
MSADSKQPRPPSDDAGGAATEDASALLLSNARLTDGRTVDVRLVKGRIEAVGTAGSLSTAGSRVDLAGYLLLPAPAEPHAHADTALSGDTTGPVSYAPEEVQRRATEAALLQLGHGATALRAHVRIGDVHALGPLEAVLQARRSLRGLADLTAVAVPRLLTGAAGADGLAMLRDAVKMGAAVVGGRPDLDPDPTGYVEAVLEVAAEHGVPVDLHTDGDDPARLARFAAMAGGLRPGVSLGPCAGLARLPEDVAGRTADRLAAAGVTAVCLPQGGCAGTERRGTAPVRLLRSAGARSRGAAAWWPRVRTGVVAVGWRARARWPGRRRRSGRRGCHPRPSGRVPPPLRRRARPTSCPPAASCPYCPPRAARENGTRGKPLLRMGGPPGGPTPHGKDARRTGVVSARRRRGPRSG